jgi:glycosyltransferase involved in cell wall biosynthesis
MGKNPAIIVVGQTPPPYGGQAVMIELMLHGTYEGIQLVHVRMDFSREMNEMGRWKFRKLGSLIRIVSEIYFKKISTGAQVLYYPPAGSKFLPVMRDIFILIATRWLFKKVIFHFHATGLSEMRASLSPPLALLYDLAYRRPDFAIRLAESAPSEGKKLDAKKEYIIPNGIEDIPGGEIQRHKTKGQTMRLLFVGLLVEDKGVLVMLEAFCKVKSRGWNVELTCMGRWDNPELEQRAHSILASKNCSHLVSFPGVLVGDNKWKAYNDADIFCFPTFFYSETFPTVLLEAMSFSLPIVSTRWRGIPDLVEDGISARLVDVRDSEGCADAICKLLADEDMRSQMGSASRKRFVDRFKAEVHWSALEKVFQEATGVALSETEPVGS